MPYYAAGDYYGRGDYYRGDYYRGDPGVFDFIKKAAGFVAGNIIPGGGLLTAGAKAVLGKVIGGRTGTAVRTLPVSVPTLADVAGAAIPMRHTQPGLPPPPIQFLGGGAPPQIGPGGTTFGGFRYGAGLGRRRRLNPLNRKALTRAERRISGFVKIARKCLRHTGYVVVSRASRGGKSSFPRRRKS
jgi:hypothetical protein